jgi:predicted enzyme related to lactoylglutathione lyase
MAFFPFEKDGSGITGALAKGEVYVPSKTGSLIYLRVESIDLTLAAVVSNGGEVLFPKSAVGAMGQVAEFGDCEGNRIALFEPAGP